LLKTDRLQEERKGGTPRRTKLSGEVSLCYPSDEGGVPKGL